MAKVKICGIQSVAEIRFINRLNPDFIGFVFCKSKRMVDREKAKEMLRHLKDNIIPVAVFRNNSLEQISYLLKDLDIRWIQLHGEEDQTLINGLYERFDCTIIKAYQPYIQSDYFIYDGKNPGSGEENNWDALQIVPDRSFIAGGLNSDNVRAIIKKLNPYAVDVSSGVETNGVKDEQKVEAFIKEVYYASR